MILKRSTALFVTGGFTALGTSKTRRIRAALTHSTIVGRVQIILAANTGNGNGSEPMATRGLTRDILTDKAFRSWREWASWKAGYECGRGEWWAGDAALDELDLAEEYRADLRPAQIVRWIMAWVPTYAEKPMREAWEMFSREARRRHRSRAESFHYARPCGHECAFFGLVGD